jgi:nucleoid-associated protein YgaU
MKRYNNIAQTQRWDGKRVYKTTYYPEIPISDNDLYVVSTESDYLDTLSFKYYNDPSLWWIIALANNIGKGRMSVEPGLQLRIPQDVTTILSEFDKINS